MKNKIIAFITLIIGISLIIIPIIINNNKPNNSKITNSSLFNKELDVTMVHKDKNIKINDFIETSEFYGFNLENLSNKTLNFEFLKIEFLDKNKKLIHTEEFNITLEKKYIKTLQTRKEYNIESKVKYIKLITENPNKK